MSVYVVRAFIQLRELALSHRDLSKRLDALEDEVEHLAAQQDSFSRNTQNQLRQLFEAPRGLAMPPEPAKRPIGFVTPQDKSPKSRAERKR